ncbi:MAG TPA: membrane protein insertase YidC [Methyloceanibacter sp.]|nr:membrane protein insertase YidC [Methyloceanibacter sp.]
MDENNRNFILAIVLSMAVLFAWQFFFAPKPTPEQEKPTIEQQQPTEPGPPQPQAEGEVPAGVTPQPGTQGAALSREEALAQSPRIAIDTPSLKGSIALKGARIDDLTLKDYRETVEPTSPNVVLLSPAGSAHAYYAEHGFVGPAGDLGLPSADTLWTAETQGALTPGTPVTLSYDNGKGLKFTRTITVDEKYMFTVADLVANTGSEPVTIYPYALVSRHELPHVQGFYILHEGLIGVVDGGLEEISYSKAVENPPETFKSDGGWLGITDKYWATVVIPEQGKSFDAKFAGSTQGDRTRFQTDYLMGPVTVAPGGSAELKGNLFAGAKEVNVVDGYAETYGIPKFDLLIDWGWFYFLTKPLFFALDYFYKLVGNFGVAILIVTVIIKLIFFPLANKSYVAMSKMKKLAPEMQRIKERYGDDRVRQQQAMMELYKKEKVNPASGCLPILIQIPIFFALYKVLFVTIEMRHAPFFGWIKDLSAPDPTSIFNLFGAIPWDPPTFMMIGVWPIIMGITMWVQMKLNPAPPDPVQQKIFTWMPVFFTFLLASFPAGLVIYWAWNNFLSVIQQATIMKRQGVEIPLLENLGIKNNKPKAKGETEG